MPPGIPVLGVGVNNAEEAARNALLILEKPAVVTIIRDQETKAVQNCIELLKQFDILYDFSDVIKEGTITINFVQLGRAVQEHGLVINVPTLRSNKYDEEESNGEISDLSGFREQTKQGLWVGLNRGENAAIAAAEIIGRNEYLYQLREEMKRKSIDENADSNVRVTYEDAGVNITAGNKAVSLMKQYIKSTFTPEVLGDIGSFGGMYAFPSSKFRNPILVSSTDGVGTKLKLAFVSGKHDTIGQDLVNHCVNDILVQGAKPLFFLDYFATGKLNPEIAKEVVKGIAQACRENNTALIGGETAEMPGMYKNGEYDLASCIVGAVERDELVTGEKIKAGDILIGLPSTGLHTNGYSLARKIFFDVKGYEAEDFIPELGCTLREALMKVHKSYLHEISRLMNNVRVKGMAHITGGGLVENIPRILPENIGVEIDRSKINILPIFRMMQREGNVPEQDMWRTFNMGIGYVIIVSKEDVDRCLLLLENGKIIGKVVSGEKKVTFIDEKEDLISKLQKQLPLTFDKTNFPLLGNVYRGKVRDNYTSGDQRVIIVTDKVSAFDRVLCTIPFKGQVLNSMARFWFEKTKDIVKNHMVEVPDPNIMIVKEVQPIPVEMVVRGYITGVTTTSAWYNYNKNGIRNFCGNILPEGMQKDQKFDTPIITPSTKAVYGEHDESVSAQECIDRELLSKELMDKLCEISMKLYLRGRDICARQGIILVDTKYEFGLLNGEIVLMDEIHTPDSSRFWFMDEYHERFSKGIEQKKIDKEYIREWLVERGFRGDGNIPEIPDEIRIEAGRRYIQTFELITGKEFNSEVGSVLNRMERNLKAGGYL